MRKKNLKLLLFCAAKKIWLLPGFKPRGTWYEFLYHRIRELCLAGTNGEYTKPPALEVK